MKRILQILLLAAVISFTACDTAPGKTTSSTKNDVLNERSEADTSLTHTRTLQPAYKEVPKQVPPLFWLREEEGGSAFIISMSDIYWTSESDHPDSLSMPAGEHKEERVQLTSKYRARLLNKTGLREQDSVFVYDYGNNRISGFAISKLLTVAYINDYASEDDKPYQEYDYMYGFEIEKKDLKGFKDYNNVIVAVGKENPFAMQQLLPMRWHKSEQKDFPVTLVDAEHKNRVAESDTVNTYSFKTNDYIFYMQDYISEEFLFTSLRHVAVIDARTSQVARKMIFESTESASPSGVNGMDGNVYDIQWCGKLFKHTAPVSFGFEWVSFGCPHISVIDSSNQNVYINCDNRH